MDCASKLSEYYPLVSKKPAEVAWCLIQFCSRYGVPKLVHSDNGKEFTCLLTDPKFDKKKTDAEVEEEGKKINMTAVIEEFRPVLSVHPSLSLARAGFNALCASLFQAHVPGGAHGPRHIPPLRVAGADRGRQ